MFQFIKSLFTGVAKPGSVAPQEKFPKAQQKINGPLFVDTETTGLNQDGEDEILEIAIVDSDAQVILNTLVRPVKKKEWADAQRVHGISPELVETAPTLTELLPNIRNICADHIVIFYNASFDLQFFPQGTFAVTECAMEKYSEAIKKRNWVKLIDAASASGYQSTGKSHRALEDALACRHVWQFSLAKINREEEAKTNAPEIVFSVLESLGVKFDLSEIDYEELAQVKVGDVCVFWTKEHRDTVHVYRPDTAFGQGKIFEFKKSCPSMNSMFERGYNLTLTLLERTDRKVRFDFEAQPSERTRLREAKEQAVAKLDPIDQDIYHCFLAHRTTANYLGGDISKIEKCFSDICASHKGRFYKSAAKSAKFAVIYAPWRLDAFEVKQLQDQGFKVTSFDKAVMHFGLSYEWDLCKYLNELQKQNVKLSELEPL